MMTSGQAVLGVPLQTNRAAHEVWDPADCEQTRRELSYFAFQLRAAALAVLCLLLESPAVAREQNGAAPGVLLEKGSCQRAGHAPVS